jgi:streptogramin lyase
MKRNYLAPILGVSVTAFAAMSVSRAVHTVAAASPGAPGLMGTVHGADGNSMSGVAVTAQATDQTYKTTVYSDGKGEFVFPPLTAGTYKVWAQAVGFATDRAQLTLEGSKPVSHDFTEKPISNFENQLTGAEWFAALPEDTPQHKKDKQVLFVSCTGCHGLDVVLNNRFDEAGWNAIVKTMEVAFYNGRRGVEDAPANTLAWEGQIERYHRADLSKYLAEMRGPGPSPMVLKPMPRPTGDAARIVVTQYDLPIQSRPSEMPRYSGDDWEKGPSVGMHGVVGVHDVVADVDGNAWITQSRTNFESNRTLVKLNPANGDMKVVNVASANGRLIFFEQIGPDPFGNIWMHGGGDFVKLEPKTETFTAYPIPRAMGGSENSIDSDSKGRIYANGNHGVLEFNPSEMDKTGVMYPGWQLHQQITPGNGITYGMSVDADDNPWWSESYSDIVATKNMKTGKVTEFLMRDPKFEERKAMFSSADLAFYDSIGAETWGANSAEPLPFSEMPRRLAADKTSDTVWIPNWAQSNIAEINIHTMKVTYHELPMRMHPYKTTVDKFHNVYTDTQVGDGMYKFNPSTQEWTFYQIPTHGCSSRHMSFDDYKNEAWIPCDQADTVDRIQFRTADQIQAAKAAGAAVQR